MFYQCIVLVVLITVMEIETQCSPEGTCSCIDVETVVILRNRCDCSRSCAVKTPELSTTPPPLQQKPPDAPIDLRVTDVTSTSVDLSFTPGFDGNSPIQCYTVQYTALGCIDFPTSVYKTRRFVLDHSNVIHLDGLEPNVEYIFQVFATNGIGSSDSSPSLREKTDDVPPQKSPHGISVDNSRRKKLLLGWQPPLLESCAGQPLGYNITWWKTWESVDEVGERQYAWIVGKNRTEFLIKRLSYATEYNIAVAACNDMGCGAFSVDVIATTRRRAKRKRCDTETCDSQQLTVTQRISTADCNLSRSDDSGAGTESKTDTPLQQLKPPKITTPNSEIVIHLGSPLKINCTLSDDDEGATLYWLHNNQTMNGTSLRVHFKEYPNRTHLVSELFIPNSLRDDAGTYRCIASTAYGQTDSMFNVKIQECPGVPIDFMATWATSTSIGVFWKQPVDGHSPITNYTIAYTAKECSVPGTWENFRTETKVVTIPNSNDSPMSYAIDNLQPNVNYDITIFATNSLGNSNVSYVMETTQDDRPNTPPHDVQVFVVGRGELHLKWQPPSRYSCVGKFLGYAATWFELSSSGTDHENSAKIERDATDFTLSQLKDDTRYNISLSVFNHVGHGPATSVIETTWRIERPGVPMNFMQTQSTSTSIEVAWKQPFDGHSPITYYTIVYTSKKCRVTGTWKDFRSQRKSVTIPNSNNSLMMYTIENLQSNVIYDLEIFATNSLGNSNVNYLEGTTQDDRPNTPPRNVQVSAVGRGQLRLEWQPPSKEACVGDFVAYTATWFELSSSVTDHGNSTKIGKDAMDFTLSKLKDDTRYNISLSVCNNIGDGPATSVIGTTWRIDPPDAPTDLRITHITATAANLSFTPPLVGHIPIDNYTIQYVTSGCDTSRKTESKRKTFVLKNSNLIHLDELKPNAEYIFSIFATNSVGSSSFSRSVRKKTNAVAPEYPPRNISVESTVRGALYIRWEPPFPESCAGYHDGYNIMRSELSTSTSQVIQTKNITVEGKDTRYYTVSSLNDGTRYNISVAARNDIGIGPYSRGIIGTTQNGERPKITTPNSEIVIHLGSPLKINCTLDGDDEGATLYWLHNNQTMNGTSRRVQSKEYPNRTHLMSELSIPKSRRDHAGTYRCIASNAYGQSHSMFNVKIQERPGVPTNFMQTQSTSTSIEVSWKQPFDGHSPITSYTISYTSKKCSVSGTWKNFRSQKKSVIIPNSNDSLMIYTIKHLQSNVIYDLKIFATNSLGNSNVNHLEATTQDDRPNTPPRDVHVWAVGRGALRLKWQPPFKESCIGDFVAYNATWLELPYSESNYKNSARIENNATDFILSKLKDDTRYNISLSVFNNIGHGPPIFVIGNTSKPAQVPATSKVDSNNSSPPNQPDSHIPSHCEPKFTKPDPKAPFTKPLTNFPVGRVGGSVSADCIVDLTKIDICSIKEIAWYRWENHVRRQITEEYDNSGNRIELRYEVVDNTKYRRIVIANLALSDAGMYTCIVSTANNTYSVGNITLYVKDRQEHLYIYLNKADKGLTCGIHTGKSPGRKIDTIRWFTYNKYGASVNITTIADVQVQRVNEYEEELIINKFYHHNAWSYCCFLIAQGGDQGGLYNQLCEEVEATGPIQNRPNTRPAFIIAGNQPQPRKEGQSLELVCGVNLKMINVKRITGIQWYKWINSTSAYTQIENTPDCTAVDRLDLDPYREHKSTLIFRSLNILDSGHYKCDIMMHDHTDHSVGYDIKVEKGRSRYRQ